MKPLPRGEQRPLRLYTYGEETRVCVRCRQSLPEGVRHVLVERPDCVAVSVYVVEVNGIAARCEGVPVPSRAVME